MKSSLPLKTDHFGNTSGLYCCERKLIFRPQTNTRHVRHSTNLLPLPAKLITPHDQQPTRTTRLYEGARCHLHNYHGQTGGPSGTEGTSYSENTSNNAHKLVTRNITHTPAIIVGA